MRGCVGPIGLMDRLKGRLSLSVCQAAWLSTTMIWLFGTWCVAATENRPLQTLDKLLTGVGYISIPLKGAKASRPVITASVNDTNCTFLVDSGWSISSIDERALGPLKTAKESGKAVSDPLFQKFNPNSFTVIEKLKLGSFELDDQSFLLKSLKSLKRQGGIPAEGVLGGDFLLRQLCILDCGQRRLYARKTVLTLQDRTAMAAFLRERGFVEIDLEPSGLFVLTCNAKVNGTATRILVDTGASATILDQLFSDRLRLPRTEKRERAVRGVGRIGASWIYSTVMDALEIGGATDGVTLANLTVGVADLSRWGIAEGPKRSSDIQGVLGIDLLSSNNAVIEYPARKLWLKGP